MSRIRSFLVLTLLGGLAVVLPMTIFVFLLQWLVGVLDNLIAPLSRWLANYITVGEHGADVLSLALVLGVCFVVGLLVKTGIGRWLHSKLDSLFSRLAPGYSTIREMVTQVMGGEGNASLLNGKVCRAYIMGATSPVSVTGIVTAEHESGDYTVYVPTAPIPTSGFVYHLPADCVVLLPEVSVEAAMRTVIACGSGSQIIMPPAVAHNSAPINDHE
ncbi:DUF502 domain-containing protein [Gilvimarinus polysaccharolyticus]|uniref:DUF502 domain-containing protein n=1 Tax=Gilvimarinus polysaccharolyticus TaxID=863921 RepID=UPI0006731E67|nr:DUF502 domain-containing protein [Gilvimarinus polysaccharolyticus]